MIWSWLFFVLLIAAGILSWYFLIIKPWMDRRTGGQADKRTGGRADRWTGKG